MGVVAPGAFVGLTGTSFATSVRFSARVARIAAMSVSVTCVVAPRVLPGAEPNKVSSRFESWVPL